MPKMNHSTPGSDYMRGPKVNAALRKDQLGHHYSTYLRPCHYATTSFAGLLRSWQEVRALSGTNSGKHCGPHRVMTATCQCLRGQYLHNIKGTDDMMVVENDDCDGGCQPSMSSRGDLLCNNARTVFQSVSTTTRTQFYFHTCLLRNVALSRWVGTVEQMEVGLF